MCLCRLLVLSSPATSQQNCAEKWTKVKQSSQPAATWPRRALHLTVPTVRVPLHGWNSKFRTDYAGSKSCQGLSLFLSGKGKCCSFPEPDTVAQFCRPEIFWWARGGDNQLAGRSQRAEASACNRYGTIIVVNSTNMLFLITWCVPRWKHSYLISIDSFWLNCFKTWRDGAPVSCSDSIT